MGAAYPGVKQIPATYRVHLGQEQPEHVTALIALQLWVPLPNEVGCCVIDRIERDLLCHSTRLLSPCGSCVLRRVFVGKKNVVCPPHGWGAVNAENFCEAAARRLFCFLALPSPQFMC